VRTVAIRAATLLVAIHLAPAAIDAQHASFVAAPSPSLTALELEMESLRAQLGVLERQALRDPELHREHLAVAALLEEAVASEDPQLSRAMDRHRTRTSLAAHSGDAHLLARITVEAETLRQRFTGALAAALQRADVRAARERHRQRLNARLVELDPAAESLLERREALEAQLIGMVAGR
jgi:hypothetical protein